jgi:D-alanine-D-alanine ligase
VFETLQYSWQWQSVTINNYKEVLQHIANTYTNALIINLCDGDDTNDAPGVSIIHYMNQLQLLYTGADEFFYNITTSKIPMKQAFDAHSVATAPWVVIKDIEALQTNHLQYPLIIKPAVSGGSMGVGVKNVVHNHAELLQRVAALQQGYRGWNLTVDGLFAEEFIVGNEYTSFIIGHYTKPNECKIYQPVFRKFHNSLQPYEQFLSFDRLWEIYEEESAMPNGDNFYEYLPVPPEDVAAIRQLTLDAFIACKGVGYARLDFRKCSVTGNLYCLEVNAQCGLSEDENYTSIGAILRLSQESFQSVILRIIEQAILK